VRADVRPRFDAERRVCHRQLVMAMKQHLNDNAPKPQGGSTRICVRVEVNA
jgi:hypothetical protein